MKYKAPENAGPSVSVGGATFNIVDGIVELPDEGNYAGALEPFGYTALPPEPADPADVVQEPAGEQEGDAQQSDASDGEAAPVDGEANEAAPADAAGEAADAPKAKVKKG